MTSLYENNILVDLKDFMNNHQDKNNVYVENYTSVKNRMEKGLMQFPIIMLSSEYNYIVDEYINYDGTISEAQFTYQTIDQDNKSHTYDIDFKNAMLANVKLSFTILAKDVSDIVQLEELLSYKYSEVQKLTIPHPYLANENIQLCITTDKLKDTERQSGDIKNGNQKEHVYQSIIHLNCGECLLFSKSYHPAQLELDNNLKAEMIKRGAALEQIRNKFNQILENQVEQNKIRLENSIKSINDMLDEIDKSTHFIREDFSYNYIHKIMCDSNYDVKRAIDECRQLKLKAQEEQRRIDEQKLREKERLNNIEIMFSKKGDKVLNRYTDAVIADIKNKLKSNSKLSIYGGSSFVDWFIVYEKGEMSFPNILVHTNSAYTFENKNYTNINSESEPIVHAFTPDALPINYGITTMIFAKEQTEVDNIENQLKNLYTDEVQILVPDSVINGEMCPIKTVIDANKEAVKKSINGGDIYRTEIIFKRFPSVYYPMEYAFTDYTNNQRLQVRMLQQAEFMLLCDSKMRQALKHLEMYYKPLFEQNKRKSLLDSVFNKIGSIFDTPEYKQLKLCFKNGSFIDRILFDKALKSIIDIYPNLYDKMMQGWSYDQIREDMNKYSEIFNKRWNCICNNLAAAECPSIFKQLMMSGDKNLPNESIRKGLAFYIKEMVVSPYKTLEQAYNAYDEQLLIEKQEREKRDAEFDEWWEARKEQRQNRNSSGGVLNTAFGVALGNKMSGNKQIKNSNRKSLWGTAMCPYGKPAKQYDHNAPSFQKITCNISCPFYLDCGGR